MPGLVSNLKQFQKGLSKSAEKQTKAFSKKVQRIAKDFHTGITERTPVWSGLTLANYQWSIGVPSALPVPAVGTYDPGPTNSMPLGTEPRRADNQAVADASFARLNFSTPYRLFILNNPNPTVGPLEDGIWPDGPGQTPRSPHGMFAITFAEVSMKLEGGYYRVP